METQTVTRWEKYSETYKRYYRENRDEVLKKNKEWKEANPHKFLYNSARQRAKKHGIHFDLSSDDIVVPERCPILDVSLVFGAEYAPSVDRINNNLGYTKENIQVISMKANRMKNNATEDELIAFARYVLMKTRLDLDDRFKG